MLQEWQRTNAHFEEWFQTVEGIEQSLQAGGGTVPGSGSLNSIEELALRYKTFKRITGEHNRQVAALVRKVRDRVVKI